MSKTTNEGTYYKHAFKAWPKQAGEKPSIALLATVHALGLRPGKQALANAMALRESGVTGAQIVLACGAPQLNKMRELNAKGLVKYVQAPVTEAGHKVYRIALTARGETKVAKATATATPEAAPAKAKRTRKAKVVAVTTPEASNEPQAIETPAQA